MAGLLERYKGWPKWAQIAAPVTVALVAISAISGGDDEKSTATTTTVGETVSLGDAFSLAFVAGEAAGLSEHQTTTLVQATCDAAGSDGGAEELATKIVSYEVERADLKALVTALGDAAEVLCPDDVADDPDLLNDTYAIGVSMLIPTQASDETTTTEASTSTTAAPVATSPPTTSPPQTSPPQTSPPQTSPPQTAPPTTQRQTVHPGAYCSPAGATGYSANGEPMTCSTQKCDGTPYDQPRWRKTNC